MQNGRTDGYFWVKKNNDFLKIQVIKQIWHKTLKNVYDFRIRNYGRLRM